MMCPYDHHVQCPYDDSSGDYDNFTCDDCEVFRMIYGVYSIRDVKTGFLSPTVDINDQVAQRNFENAVLNADHSLFFTHPDDYSFYRLASFNSDSGRFEALELPEFICDASSVFGIRDKRGEI